MGTLQKTMSNPWTPDQMPSCRDKTVLITGANSGLGFEATKAFAARGATVIMACRSLDRGERAAHEIASQLDGSAGGTLTVRECDLASLDSVRSFAEGVRAAYDELHILCNNAGVMAIPRSETADGFEMQLGVNHLGHFALTGLLLDRILDTDGETRIVTHASAAHSAGEMNFDDLQREESYGKWEAYGQSKLANLLFAYELNRLLRAAGHDTQSVACHPGYADTNLQFRGAKEADSRLQYGLMRLANTVFGQSPEGGVRPLLYAATAPDVVSGGYYGPDGFLSMRGAPERQESNAASHDQDDAETLWAVSEELTGVRYEMLEIA